MNSNMREFVEFALGMVAILGTVIIFAFGIVGIANKTGFPAQLAQIEVVRSSLQEVAPGDRGELIRMAVKWNENIVDCQYWNSR